jgi:integrase
LCAASRAGHLIRLRKLFDLLADHAFPPRPGLLLSEDIPRPDQTLPRPLTPEDDARLQAVLRLHNDLLSSALLLTRLTGMRIGETVDLSPDCLRHLGADQWSLHVPVGKLHNERWTPVDEQVRTLIARLCYLRTLPPAAPPEFLLPRPKAPQRSASSRAPRYPPPLLKPESPLTLCPTRCAIPTPQRCGAPASACQL